MARLAAGRPHAENSTDTARLLLGGEGTIAGKWDYRLDLSHSFRAAPPPTCSTATPTPRPCTACSAAASSIRGRSPEQGQTQAAMDALESTKFYGASSTARPR
jgi:iron complex outermembrane receptor protein